MVLFEDALELIELSGRLLTEDMLRITPIVGSIFSNRRVRVESEHNGWWVLSSLGDYRK